eukprot:Hpha_TRINITY_DN7314_c0_g1::TRINITY_DN7314_c0_g1_i1::g.9999::m.9999
MGLYAEGSNSDAHSQDWAVVILLSSVAAFIFILWLAVFFKLKRSGSVKLAFLLFVSHITSVCLAGVCAWALTHYLGYNRLLNKNVSNLLIASGEAAKVRVIKSLDDAATITKFLVTSLEVSVETPAPYPNGALLTKRAYALAGDDSITLIYWGLDDGQFVATRPLELASLNKSHVGLWEVMFSSLPTNKERRCSDDGSCNLLPACRPRAGDSGCSFCETNFGAPPEEDWCEEWTPATQMYFVVPEDTHLWDVPIDRNGKVV